MDVQEVLDRRAAAGHLTGPPLPGPVEVVRHLLAVQSQDVQPSAWSVGMRCGAAAPEVDDPRADGRLVRTHVLRTTWHDVAAEDLRWLLRLTGPRVRRQLVRARREHGLDDEVLRRARQVVGAALAAEHLTRPQLGALLGAAGLPATGPPLAHLLMQLELDGLLCSGPPQGRRQAYALLDERVPPAPEVPYEQAVADLALRFLRGHGPTSVADLAWWASLTGGDLRRALAALGDAVVREDLDGRELWSAADAAPPQRQVGARLLPTYDEHLVAFPATRDVVDPDRVVHGRIAAAVLQDGRVVGTWTRELRPRSVTVRVRPAQDVDVAALEDAVQAYGAFVGLPAELVLVLEA